MHSQINPHSVCISTGLSTALPPRAQIKLAYGMLSRPAVKLLQTWVTDDHFSSRLCLFHVIYLAHQAAEPV